MSTSGMTDAVDQMQRRNDYEGVIFLGTVVNNADPQHEERLRIRVPNLWGQEIADSDLPWCRPMKHRVRGSYANVQSFSVPAVGSKMYVELQNGDPYHPLYRGSLLLGTDLHSIFVTNYPNRYGLADDKGNTFYVDTQTGDVELRHFSGLVLHVAPNGGVSIQGPQTLSVAFKGNVSANVGGNLQATISGTTSVNSTGALTVQSSASVTITAPTVDIN